MPSRDPAEPPPDRRPTADEPDNEPERAPESPSALALARLSPYAGFPPGGEDLYRHVVRLVEMAAGHEFVVVPCGRGVTSRFLARLSGAAGAGADPEAEPVEIATARARDEGLTERLHYEHAPLEDLPYQDEVFDVAVGEVGLAAASDPEAAVSELVRVTKPMGTVVLIQPMWTRAVEAERREMLIEHLGVRPFLLVEWKQMLREAGVVDLYVEDWSDALGMQRQPLTLRRLAEFFSLGDRLAILYRAWQRWGWRGAREAIEREREIRRLVAEERVLGVSLIKGVKWHERTQSQQGEAEAGAAGGGAAGESGA